MFLLSEIKMCTQARQKGLWVKPLLYTHVPNSDGIYNPVKNKQTNKK